MIIGIIGLGIILLTIRSHLRAQKLRISDIEERLWDIESNLHYIATFTIHPNRENILQFFKSIEEDNDGATQALDHAISLLTTSSDPQPTGVSTDLLGKSFSFSFVFDKNETYWWVWDSYNKEFKEFSSLEGYLLTEYADSNTSVFLSNPFFISPGNIGVVGKDTDLTKVGEGSPYTFPVWPLLRDIQNNIFSSELRFSPYVQNSLDANNFSVLTPKLHTHSFVNKYVNIEIRMNFVLK